MYKNLETLLVSAANGKEFEEHFKIVTEFYGIDFNPSRLRAQLEILTTHFQTAGGHVSLKNIKASILPKCFCSCLKSLHSCS